MAEVVIQSTPEVLLDESFYKAPGLFSIAELCGNPEEQAIRNKDQSFVLRKQAPKHGRSQASSMWLCCCCCCLEYMCMYVGSGGGGICSAASQPIKKKCRNESQNHFKPKDRF